jgi:hypothetical protein
MLINPTADNVEVILLTMLGPQKTVQPVTPDGQTVRLYA